MDIFVSGRLCLFGEHSDWAGEYRRVNSRLQPGYAIVIGTNQGIYARVEQNVGLNYKTIYSASTLKLAMEPKLLLSVAQSESFYSYIAGVAYQALSHYRVGGLSIDNYRLNLPLRKGLSSSAAVCVLVARAFNQLYQLNLSIAEEMELAYWGERTTPSQCGRLDQACAYGKQPILMSFDGDSCSVKPLEVGQNLYLIIVDLAGSKDTQTILARLHQCYPTASGSVAIGVQKYLGETNQELTRQAVTALQQGDARRIGSLMNQTQKEFDSYIAPVCPEQLNAPLLHQLLDHPALQPYICGGKGVGSQGDGTAQLIAPDKFARQQAIAVINRDFPQMQCFKLDLPRHLLKQN